MATKYQQLIFNLIKNSNKPLTINDISKQLKDYQIDKSTIYRNIDKLVKNGEIYESSEINNSMSYFGSHNHFVCCRDCKKIITIKHDDICDLEKALDKLEKKLSKQNKLGNINHQLKFTSTCYDCSN